MVKKLQRKDEKVRTDKDVKKLEKTMIFLVKLSILSIPMYMVLKYHIDFEIIRDFIAFHTSHFLSFMGLSSQANVHGIIGLRNSSIVINRDCTGWKGIWFFVALMLSTELPFKKKILGILTGAMDIFSVNILRIVVMIWIELNFKDIFPIVHGFLWQVSMIFIVLMLWYIWLKGKIINCKR